MENERRENYQKVSMYSIFDCLSNDFGPLMECKNDVVAQRLFLDTIRQRNLNPQDFRLYAVGFVERFDDEIQISSFKARPVAFSTATEDFEA